MRCGLVIARQRAGGGALPHAAVHNNEAQIKLSPRARRCMF
jgi:hypothetical protein